MSEAAVSAGTTVWSGVRLRGAPARVAGRLLAVEVAAVGATLPALLAAPLTSTLLLRLVLLVGLGTIFEEISLKVGKLRQLITSGPLADLTSVWTFAAAIALPAGYAALFAVVIRFDVWFHRNRASGTAVYREIYTGATIVIAVLATGAVRANIESRVANVPWSLVTAAAIVSAAAVYTYVQRVLVISAARQIYPDADLHLIGSWEDNALELATLCLGAMTGVVLIHQPWVSVLVLLPMVLLQRGALIKDLEEAASTDAKTGLLNATVWHGSARRELARVDRDNATAAVLILDLDHFKSVNDDHGHLFGDAALLAVGTRLKAEVRQYDLLGRFGGEEFVVLLPRVTYGEATAAAERLRLAIASIVYEEFGDAFLQADSPARARNLSVSIGVSLYPEHGTDVDELLHKADAALYAAKHAGRNRVTVALSGDTIH